MRITLFSIISFFIAIAIYFLLGHIVWNIVYSFLDLKATTMIQLMDYRLCSYSLLVTIILCGTVLFFMENSGGRWFVFVAILNLGIAIAVNHWENAWESVISIINWVYNIINVCELWFTFFCLLFLIRESINRSDNCR